MEKDNNSGGEFFGLIVIIIILIIGGIYIVRLEYRNYIEQKHQTQNQAPTPQ